MASDPTKLIPPTDDSVAAAVDLNVYDDKGKSVRFGSLFENERIIVVFIRHFFCGVCQDYVTQLASVSPDALNSANTKIVVIGCGEWELIDQYHKDTGFTGPIYTDPTRKLYRALGMTRESMAGPASGAPKRSYVRGVFSVTMRSIRRGIRNPLHVGKQGNFSQIGGDLILGPGNKVSFVHLMENSQDHIDVPELMQAAGVQYP
ncbi:hypothetical protein BD410DRAFT_792170 [Rickenella mellea]|uniref:AhpC-TSA-domain-containing protein n=1 Tax=Rickenella mellea TaxID=50990 RepID=A0A4Y7PVD0_9AGAM|nr:hypothetical protein BD410DRAFT_792170 [Rickenella mellea]